MLLKRRRWLLAAAALLLINAGLYLSVQFDRAYIRRVALEVAGGAESDEAIVEALLEHLRYLPKYSDAQLNELPWWVRADFRYNRLRPGPRMTLEHGRHQAACQVTARALVAMLRPYGIKWRAVTLHDSQLHGSHGTLEIEFDRGPGVVDPLFALIYRHPDGRPASRKDLQGDPSLFRANASRAWQTDWGPGGETRRLPYPVERDGYGFEHAYAFSYHWFGPARWFVRDTLAALFGPDGPLLIHRPGWRRYPAMTLLVFLDTMVAGFLAFQLFLAWRRRRRASQRGDSGPAAAGPAFG